VIVIESQDGFYISCFLKSDRKKGERSMIKEEKVSAADDFFLEMEEKAYTGAKIIKVIVISSYVFLVADFILSIFLGTLSLWNVLIWVLWAIFYYKLYTGRTWAKWLYIISCAVGTVLSVIILVRLTDAGLIRNVMDEGSLRLVIEDGTVKFAGTEHADYTVLVLALWISLVAAARIVFCVLLIASKSVQEFLYRQLAGG
jgi:hypothetical protein